jgi:TonB family protein
LIRFDWVLESADSDQEARLRLAKSLIERMDSLLRMIVNAEPVQPRLPYHGRVALDLTREEPPPTYEAPTFVKREQPLYTPEAERAEVSGTVEIEAVFGQDGNLREPEIIRWAGYGLDQSALQAAERIRFTPAKLNGARISVKARLRYNFTRRQPR